MDPVAAHCYLKHLGTAFFEHCGNSGQLLISNCCVATLCFHSVEYFFSIWFNFFVDLFFVIDKGQMISKWLLVFLDSPKKWTNENVVTTAMNSFVRFLGEFEDT